MRIQLSDHFTYKRLLRFVMPSIVMMICTSVYSIVDGLFVSNFVGKTPFAAVNLIFPFLMAMGTIGFMIGTGGSAVVAITPGEGEPVFFISDLCLDWPQPYSLGRGAYRPAAGFRDAGRRRGAFGALRGIRPDSDCRADGFYFAKCIPELFCDRGKAGLKP